MKKLFFIAVLLGTIGFIGIFTFSYFRLRNKAPEAYFETGKKLYDQGKFSDATIEFMNAVRRDGNNRDNRYYLALSYLGQQDLGSAVRQLKALLELSPDDVPANLKLGEIYLSGGPTNSDLYRLTLESTHAVLAKDPNNIEALLLAGNASAGIKDYDAAVDSLEKAVALDPKSVSGWISLGSVRAQQRKFPEAEKAFRTAREVDPKNKSALVSLANFYRIAGSPEKADALFREGLSQYPADRDIYAPAVNFYLGQQRYDEVGKILRAAQAARESDPSPTLALADIFHALNRTEDARKLLLDAKPKFPNNIELAAKLATNLMADMPDQARREIDFILKAEPKNPIGHVLLGELQFTLGQFDAAAETLGQDPALGSSFPQVHYLLGDMAFKKGKLDEAQAHYQQSIKVNGSFIPAKVALANEYMVRGRPADAEVIVRQLLALDPMNISGRLIKAKLGAADKANSKAETEFSSLVKEFPGNPEVHRQMGLYFSSRGKTVDAEKSLSRAVDLAPNEQNFTDLILFYLQSKQVDRAAQKLNSVPDGEKQAFHYELVGLVAEQAGKPQDAETAYKRALEKDPNRLSAENFLFNQYLRNGRLDDAINRLDALAKRIPTNATVPAMKGAVEEIKGNSKAAEGNYRKALQIDPTIILAANNLAYLLAQEGRDLQTALGLAQNVRRQQPQDASAADTLGWVYFKLNRPVPAKEQGEFAVSIHPENGVFQYHLGKIYRMNSQNTEAVAALKKAVASAKASKERDLAEAELKDLLKGLASAKP